MKGTPREEVPSRWVFDGGRSSRRSRPAERARILA
jgi:hypothetical protein